jgi:hypothetical protein
MIRKMNYREHYYPNQTDHDTRDMEVHISENYTLSIHLQRT